MMSISDDFRLAFKTGNILKQIIIINVAVFAAFGVLNVLMTLSGQESLYRQISMYLSLSAAPEKLIYRPWSIITYFFFHKGIFHLLWNMLIMYWFGRIITEFLGQHKLLGLYIWGGIGGGVLYLLAYNLLPYFADVVAFSALLGASAGVTAIVVGAATFQPNLTIPLIFLGPIRLKYIAAFMVAFSFLQSTGSNAGGEIAHLGGALAGYLFTRELQKGHDWSRPVVRFMSWVKSLFKPQPKIKVTYRNTQKTSGNSKRRPEKTETAPKQSAKKPVSQSEIDAILDKISEKGYDALSKEEKQQLFNASKD